MKILSAQQTKEWDAFTIANEPIASIDLMERAADACEDFIVEHFYDVDGPVKIFCGKGNNGGDGLGIARILIEDEYEVAVYILETGTKGSADFETNLERLQELTDEIYFVESQELFPQLEKDDLIIDALYGSGLNRPLEGLSAALVKHINSAGATVVSIDVPSGMPLDKSCIGHAVIKAGRTLTFQALKLCFLMAENADLFGEVEVIDIQLNENFLSSIKTTFALTEATDAKEMHVPRKVFANKGNYGHALLIAGNTGKMGAAVIASRACLRSGAGLLTLNIPEASFPIIHTAIPEAMCESRGKESPTKYTALGIGPGIGKEDEMVKMVGKIIRASQQPMVIDADALNILGEHWEWLAAISKDTVLTPHPKEFERVFGKAGNDFERANKAIELSLVYPFVIVLKGHYTLVASGGKGYFNTTGNAGMAKGGSGDMLTGIITALLAQKYTPLQAAIFGVYLHGFAGDKALEKQSLESLLPSDMIEYLGSAFQEITQKK